MTDRPIDSTPATDDPSPERLDLLVPYVDGELDVAERERVEAFLSTSASARTRVRQHRLVARQLAAMQTPAGLADADTTLAAVGRRLRRSRVLRLASVLTAAAAIILVALLGRRMLDDPDPTGPDPIVRTPAASGVSDVDTTGSPEVFRGASPEVVTAPDALLDDLDVLEDLHDEIGRLDGDLVDLLVEELALDDSSSADSSSDGFPPLDPSLLDVLLEEEILGENL